MTDPSLALINYRNVPAIPKNNYCFNYNNWLCSLDKLTYSLKYCHGLQCYLLEKSVVNMYCKMWSSHCLKSSVYSSVIGSKKFQIFGHEKYFCIQIIKNHSSKYSEHFVLTFWLDWNKKKFELWISGKPWNWYCEKYVFLL